MVVVDVGDAAGMNFVHGQRVDIIYRSWTGRPYTDAVDDCLQGGGEPIAYSWDPTDAAELTCEDVDF
jgi:hypothetical protein